MEVSVLRKRLADTIELSRRRAGERRAAPRGAAVTPSTLPTLLVFAWGLEVVGVACGVVNAALTTFPRAFPATLAGWLPADQRIPDWHPGCAPAGGARRPRCASSA